VREPLPGPHLNITQLTGAREVMLQFFRVASANTHRKTPPEHWKSAKISRSRVHIPEQTKEQRRKRPSLAPGVVTTGCGSRLDFDVGSGRLGSASTGTAMVPWNSYARRYPRKKVFRVLVCLSFVFRLAAEGVLRKVVRWGGTGLGWRFQPSTGRRVFDIGRS
jgi:hypothetical protein